MCFGCSSSFAWQKGCCMEAFHPINFPDHLHGDLWLVFEYISSYAIQCASIQYSYVS